MSSRVGIIIVNYKTPDLTIECLRSLYLEKELSCFSVVIVDNDSQDGSFEKISAAIVSHGALTARVRGFKNAEEYGHWIAEDARNVLIKPVNQQVRDTWLLRDQSFIGKVRRKIHKVIGLQ